MLLTAPDSVKIFIMFLLLQRVVGLEMVFVARELWRGKEHIPGPTADICISSVSNLCSIPKLIPIPILGVLTSPPEFRFPLKFWISDRRQFFICR